MGMKSFALLASVVGSLVVFASTAADAQQACTAYEHANYKGWSFGVGTNKSVGNSKLNNVITSIKVVSGCSFVAYSENNFRGPSITFKKSVPYVGKQWDNAISSYRCVCR
jgi:hypothetical protein